MTWSLTASDCTLCQCLVSLYSLHALFSTQGLHMVFLGLISVSKRCLTALTSACVDLLPPMYFLLLPCTSTKSSLKVRTLPLLCIVACGNYFSASFYSLMLIRNVTYIGQVASLLDLYGVNLQCFTMDTCVHFKVSKRLNVPTVVTATLPSAVIVPVATN